MATNSFSLSSSSTLFPSPLLPPAGSILRRFFNFRRPLDGLTSCHSSSVAFPKKRHWKQGEYPGFTEQSNKKKTPIKNIKKKLDRKSNAKGWVNTVTEALSDHIDKKQWVQALEVFEMLKEQPLYQSKESTYMKLLVLVGRCGQPGKAQLLFDTMIEEEGLEPTTEFYTALVGAYCRSNIIDKAFTILHQMIELPYCQPNVYDLLDSYQCQSHFLSFQAGVRR